LDEQTVLPDIYLSRTDDGRLVVIGEKRGANNHGHQAACRTDERQSSQVYGLLSHIRQRRATSRLCLLSSGSQVRSLPGAQVTDIGPVFDVQDVAGGKVCALAGRVEPRDYADTAAMLEHYSPAQLIGFARRLDADLEGRDFADAGRRLDRLPDQVFASIGLSHEDITAVRDRFASWPADR
jgi:hypothetical protein